MKKLIVLILIFAFATDEIKSQNSWEVVSNLPFVYTSFEVFDNIIYATAGTNTFGVWVSSDSGVTWENRKNGLDSTGFFREINSIAKINSFLFCSGYDVVYSSTNQGMQWQNVTNNLMGSFPSVVFTNGIDLFAAANGLFVSTNNGSFWELRNANVGYIWDYAFNSFMMYIVRNTIGFSISTDNGYTWVNKNNGITNLDLRGILVSGNDLFVCGWDGVFKSTNFGDSWTEKNNNLATNYAVRSIKDLAEYNNKLIALRQTGVYLSTNNGELWGLANNGFPSYSPNLDHMFIIGNYVYVVGNAAGERTLYKRNLDVMTNINFNESDISYKLFQNYPNPFNPSTIIKFTNPSNSFVRLNVYNSLGKNVSSIVNQTLEAGSYSFEFYENDLPSGVYYYTLETNDYKETKKMVLMK